MTQHELVKEYIKEFGSILPAKISGVIYGGVMFGSETSKRCRELRGRGELTSDGDGRFERFYLVKPKEPVDYDDRLKELLKKIPKTWDNAKVIGEINNAIKSKYDTTKKSVWETYRNF
jgi:hypothetical protein